MSTRARPGAPARRGRAAGDAPAVGGEGTGQGGTGGSSRVSTHAAAPGPGSDAGYRGTEGAAGQGGGAGDEPRPGRRELQRRETERLIRTTALALFRAHGFDATTTKQIAEAAGVAHGTVFLVAATKEALLVKVLEAQLREVVATRTQSLPKRRIVAQLVHVFDGLFDFYAGAPHLSRVFLKGVMFFAEPIARGVYDEHVARFSRYLAALFEAAQTRGELAARASSEAAAANVLALYVYLVVAFLNADTPDRAALGAGFRAGLDALSRGWAPRDGAAR